MVTDDNVLSAVANGNDQISFTIGVTLPIWRSRINASMAEASAGVVAASRDFDDARDDTFRQIRRLSDQALATDEQLRLYEARIVPRAHRAIELAVADYRGGLVDFGELADRFSELLMFELQTARAKATLAGQLAQLERAVGCEVVTPADDIEPETF